MFFYKPKEIADRYQDMNEPQISIAETQKKKKKTDKLARQNRILKQELKELNQERYNLKNAFEVNKKAQKHHENKAREFYEAARVSRQDQLFAEEKFRRQTEVLNNRTTELDEAMQVNQKLALQQMKLEKWTEKCDDDEISQLMNSLCQQLEAWGQRHFPTSTSDGYDFYELYAHVSSRIFKMYLSRVLVGIGDDSNDELVSQKIDSLDQMVQEICQ